MSSLNVYAAQAKKSITVNGYATADITREQLVRWADNLTYISYYSYGFTMEGELIPIEDTDLIRIAYESGVAPLMVLTPFDETGICRYDLVKEVLTNPHMRDRLINNIVLSVAEKNYYGVVINFGYIAEEDRNEFVVTVAKSAARLNRRGKLIIVSVVAGESDEGIDYESLSRAANFIELRTFREEQISEPPSPISPIDRMRQTIFEITAMADPRFILLAIPNFGFDWSLPYIQGRTAAETISVAEAADRAARTGVAVQYSETAHSPHYHYADAAGIVHAVWFEDERSLRVKLELVYDYDLAGVSIWTIMSPFPEAAATIEELFTVKKV